MSAVIAQWLDSLGLGHLAQTFAENGVDEDLLSEITNDDLKDLGAARLAHRKKLLKAIAERDAIPPPADEASTAGAAERRQLTVMFCDLVGSTALRRLSHVYVAQGRLLDEAAP